MQDFDFDEDTDSEEGAREPMEKKSELLSVLPSSKIGSSGAPQATNIVHLSLQSPRSKMSKGAGAKVLCSEAQVVKFD